VSEVRSRHFRGTVIAAEAGTRLDQWLTVRLPELSRTRIRKAIDQGMATVDGRAAKSATIAEVTVGEDAAQALGIRTGDSWDLIGRWGTTRVRVAGLFRPLNPADPRWSYDNFVDMSYYFEALGGKRTAKSDKAHNTLVKLAASLYGDRTLATKLYTYNKDLFAKRGVSQTKAQTYALPAGTSIRY